MGASPMLLQTYKSLLLPSTLGLNERLDAAGTQLDRDCEPGD